MTRDQALRKRLRLRAFDYTTPRYYFVTICCHARRPLFGEVRAGEMHLDPWGEIARRCWEDLPVHHGVDLGSSIVMPNHHHGLLKPDGPALSTIVGSFKSAVTRRIREAAGDPGLIVWQRGYYEHVVRDEAGLAKIAEYIQTNPMRWEQDRENPDRRGFDEFHDWLLGQEQTEVRAWGATAR